MDLKMNSFIYDTDNWYIYSEGYKRAGDILVEYATTNGIDQDILVYPVCFLYRQYIELQLKELIRDGKKLLEVSEKNDNRKNHDIDASWKKFREIVDAIWPDSLSADLDWIENIIHQFSKIDPKSFTFRYPTDQKDVPINLNIKQISLINISEIMTNISFFFEGASAAITAAIDRK